MIDFRILKEQVSEPQLLIDRLLNILNNPEYGENVYVIRGKWGWQLYLIQYDN